MSVGGSTSSSAAWTTTESMSSVGCARFVGDQRAPYSNMSNAGAARARRRRRRGSRTPARPPRRARGDPPRGRRAGCRSSASAARRRRRRGSRSARPSGTASSSTRVRRRSSSSSRRTIRGVRPVRHEAPDPRVARVVHHVEHDARRPAGPGAACRRTAGRRRAPTSSVGVVQDLRASRRRSRPTRSPRRRACARSARATTPAPRRGAARRGRAGSPARSCRGR